MAKEKEATQVAEKVDNGTAKTKELKPDAGTAEVPLSKTQLQKLNKLYLQEQNLKNELQKVQTNIVDVYELILDNDGWSEEKMSSVTNIQPTEQGTLRVEYGEK